DANDRAAEDGCVELEGCVYAGAGQLGYLGDQFVPLILAQLARGGNFCRPYAQLFLKNSPISFNNFGYVANAVIVNENRDEIAEFLLQAELRIHLVEEGDLLRFGNRRIHEELAQFGAAIPGGKKVG